MTTVPGVSDRPVPGLVRRQGLVAGLVAGVLLGAVAYLGAHVAFEVGDWGTDRVVLATMVAWVLGFNLGVGSLNGLLSWLLGREPGRAEEHYEAGVGRGRSRYTGFCTDHKVVGVQYLVLVMVLFGVGGTLAVPIRTQLLSAHSTLLTPTAYNDIVTLHGMCMIIATVLMVTGVFGNFVLPLMIGARTVAFPGLNAMALWVLVSSVVCLLSTLAIGGVDAGWTTYAPLADQATPAMTAFAVSVVGLVFCVVAGGINTVATVIGLRARGMSMARLPVFTWGTLIASALAVYAMAAVLLVMLLVIADRTMGTTFFVAQQGGSAWLYEIAYWTMGQPLIYVILIPPMAALVEVVSTFARRPVFNPKLVVGSFAAIAVLSVVTLGHHLFTSGWDPGQTDSALVVSQLIAVPSGIIVLCLLGTLWGGTVWTRLPMYFAYLFLWDLVIGGISGVFLANPTVDRDFHGGMVVTAHFHFALVGAAMVAATAALCYWFPKMTGRMFDERTGKVAFWMIAVGIQVTFLAQFWAGVEGMPRRVAWYDPVFRHANQVSSAGAYLLTLGWLVFLVALVRSWRHGEVAPADPWRVRSLEWQVPTPVPLRNFPVDPVVTDGPGDPVTTPVTAAAPVGDGT